MFNNANVIFRTKFVDGVSTVSRTLGSRGGSSRRAALANGNSSSGIQGAAKKRRGEHNAGKENSTQVIISSFMKASRFLRTGMVVASWPCNPSFFLYYY
ncbi:hypothetical protein THAOC_05742, partial [Thalassiosira oceanica]